MTSAGGDRRSYQMIMRRGESQLLRAAEAIAHS